ncbi:MAG TPA: DUF4231 domain-containing protein [Acidobacteriaceae bacterium]
MSGAGSGQDDFEELVAQARSIKEQYVDPRLSWYRTHTMVPRRMFRAAGMLTIVLSVTLPALAAAPAFAYKGLALSVSSIAIAALTGLGSFYRWERTWRGNSTAQMALEQHIAKWELELANARLVVAADKRSGHVYQATDDLLAGARGVVSLESEGFFSTLQFPQQSTSSKL